MNWLLRFAMWVVVRHMKTDSFFYCGWQSNIAMAFKDERNRCEKLYLNKDTIHKIANKAANNFLKMLIGRFK